MIVAARICDLCGAIVTSRTVHIHYSHFHHTDSAADWKFACWPDGQAALLFVDDDTLELAMSW